MGEVERKIKTTSGGLKMKTISVLLTKYSDCISTFIYYISGREYTHASIALEEPGENAYYSFNYKGFCEETIKKHRKKGVCKSARYRFEVSDKTYEKIKRRLHFFKMHRSTFAYSRLGVLLCLLHIPFCRKNHYFCSQFVAELPEDAEEIRLKKPSSLYLPNDLRQELADSPCLMSINYNVV